MLLRLLESVAKQFPARTRGYPVVSCHVSVRDVPMCHLDLTETETGETALHQAAALGLRSICHFLVEAGASLMKTDLQGDTPKHRAAKAQDLELADYLGNRQHYQMIQREDEETAV